MRLAQVRLTSRSMLYNCLSQILHRGLHPPTHPRLPSCLWEAGRPENDWSLRKLGRCLSVGAGEAVTCCLWGEGKQRDCSR